MKVNPNNIVKSTYSNKVQTSKNQQESVNTYSQTGIENLAAYNKAGINFKGYYGDQQPAKKLFWILTGRNNICKVVE